MKKLFGIRSLGFLLVIGYWSLVIAAGAAAVPQYFNYQGVLKDSAGNLQTGAFSMKFKIYDALTSGTAVYDSGTVGVSVASGIYNVSLEATSTIFTGDNRWLEVTVGSDVLTPRLKINSVAYAITAERADKVNNLSLVVGTDTLPAGTATVDIANSAVTANSTILIMPIRSTSVGTSNAWLKIKSKATGSFTVTTYDESTTNQNAVTIDYLVIN